MRWKNDDMFLGLNDQLDMHHNVGKIPLLKSIHFFNSVLHKHYLTQFGGNFSWLNLRLAWKSAERSPNCVKWRSCQALFSKKLTDFNVWKNGIRLEIWTQASVQIFEASCLSTCVWSKVFSVHSYIRVITFIKSNLHKY